MHDPNKSSYYHETPAERDQYYRSNEFRIIADYVKHRDYYRCQKCGARGRGVELHCHHLFYDHWRQKAEFDYASLITWCSNCHTEHHGRTPRQLTWDELAVEYNRL